MLMIWFYSCQMSRHLGLAKYQKRVAPYEDGQGATKKQVRSKENLYILCFVIVFNKTLLLIQQGQNRI